MSVGTKPAENLKRASEFIEQAGGQRRPGRLPAGIVPLAIFLPARRRRPVRPGRAVPGPTTEALAPWPRTAASSSSARFSSAAPRRLPQHRRWSSMPTARCSASTAKCTSRTTRCTTRNSTSRPATWASAPSIRASGGLRRWSAGTSGIPRRRGWRLFTARRFCSIPPPSAGIRGEGGIGAAQHDAWRTIQRSHAIANGVYVAAVNRVGYEGPPEQRPGILGRARSSPTPSAGCWRKPRTPGGDADRRVRPAPDRGDAPQLAFPARPPDRRLQGHRQRFLDRKL